MYILPKVSDSSEEYNGSFTFGETNINGESYSPGENPFLYYDGTGTTMIVESKYGHKSVLESDMGSITFYKVDLFLNESYHANCEPSPISGVQTIEWWWAFDYISLSDWTPSPTVWIYTDADSNPLNDTTVINIAWVKPPGHNDQISCQVYDYVTDTKPYRTPDSMGIDLSDTLKADKFYHFRISLDYDLNQITWAINGEEGWRTETFSDTDLAGDYGNITKIGFGAGYSYLDKHWMDSLSWTWNDEYTLGDLVNTRSDGPPSGPKTIWDYWYYFVIGLVALGGIASLTVVLSKKKPFREKTPPQDFGDLSSNVEVFYCPNCGVPLPKLLNIKAEFCPFCGNGLPKI